MLLLLLILLVILTLTFLFLFGVFKLIFWLAKNNRNLWPLILAGVGTCMIAVVVVGGAVWVYHKSTAPFRPLIERLASTPSWQEGERSYHDNTFPFSITVFDGMDFSDWIRFQQTYVKIGIDTNFFRSSKQAAPTHIPTHIMSALVRLPHTQNTDRPFEFWETLQSQNMPSGKIEVFEKRETTINNLPSYWVKMIIYTSNSGQMLSTEIPVWIAGIADPENKVIYYVIAAQFGPEDKTEQITTMLESFRLIHP